MSPMFSYTIYRRPRDYPRYFVVRASWITRGGPLASPACELYDTLDAARAALSVAHPGAVVLERDPCDDPVIVETWL
jgi:hypothetical protein